MIVSLVPRLLPLRMSFLSPSLLPRRLLNQSLVIRHPASPCSSPTPCPPPQASRIEPTSATVKLLRRTRHFQGGGAGALKQQLSGEEEPRLQSWAGKDWEAEG